MPLSKQHKQNSREKILVSAIQLFNAKGFEQVSINQLMTHAGLTRGAFYTHFKNKQAIYSEAIIEGVRRSSVSQVKPKDLKQRQWIKQLVDTYLSMEHINQECNSCPLAFLVTDIANSMTEVQDTYAKIFENLNNALFATISKTPKTSKSSKNKTVKKSDVYAATTLMIGSIAIGRAMNNKEQTTELLKSTRENVYQLLDL